MPTLASLSADVPPPPRTIPARVLSRRHRTLRLVGLILLIVSAVELVLYGVLGLLLPPLTDLSLDRSGTAKEQATAHITSLAYLRHTRINNKHPYKIGYRFTADTGSEIDTVGYSFNPALVKARVGDAISIEYAAGSPNHSRPVGGMASVMPFGVWLLLILLVCPTPIAAAILLVIAQRRRARTVRLLERGDATLAEVTKVSMNRNIRMNNRSPYNLQFLYEDDQGREHNGKVLSFQFDWAGALMPGDKLVVVYNPIRPAECVLWLHGDEVDEPGSRTGRA